MKHFDAELHVQGKSLFTGDLPEPDGLLHAAVLVSPVACGKIVSLDAGKALEFPGVRAVITAMDIPGENQIGNIIMDEPLLAEGAVHFIGEPVAIVAAESAETALCGVKLINLEIDELPAVTDPREAFRLGNLIAPPRTFSIGDIESAWNTCDLIVEGTAETGGQEHVYLETQCAIAIPAEGGAIRIHSSTQGPSFVQKVAARVLDIPIHMVEVDVIRLGGAFGGKEDQATPWAVMAALAAALTGHPVKFVLRRKEDILFTGKRHPYSSDFRMGLDADGKILAWEVSYFQNGGAASDLSTTILERTLFHCTNSYFIPNVKATGYCCMTNLAPNTAFRGFGGPQAMFVLEAAIRAASEKMRVDASFIQEKNLLCTGDRFPYGMEYKGDEVRRSWKKLHQLYNVDDSRSRVEKFNRNSRYMKKGLSLMPVCFGISFTTTFLNQANALVHVYTDGSIGISTGAIEMGQGVNSKIRQVAAEVFSVDISRTRVETTNTTRAANTSPTAASSAADMNGNATRIACENIRDRLLEVAREVLDPSGKNEIILSGGYLMLNGDRTDLSWEKLIQEAYLRRVNLSSQAHYATPGIFFDKTSEKGEPFAYHVAGTALTEVTADCLRGTYTIDRVDVVHDCGKSINPLVDKGQIEGGLLQGIGWVTMEELVYNKDTNRLVSDSLATYKIPDIHFAPAEVRVHFLEPGDTTVGLSGSKAVGEPPFMYGIGTWFAILEAIKAFDPEADPGYVAPMTPERLLLSLPSLLE